MLHSIAPAHAARLLVLAARNVGTLRGLYSPDQPRDTAGQWTAGSGEGAGVTHRPDGLPIVQHPAERSLALRRGIKVGSRVRYHYRAIDDDFGHDGSGRVVGFVNNRGRDTGSIQDVVIRDGENIKFVAEKNVRATHRRALEFNPDQARDDHGRWSGGASDVYTGSDSAKIEAGRGQVTARLHELEVAGADDPANHEFAALAHMETAIDYQQLAPLSRRQYIRSAYVFEGETLVAAGVARMSKDKTTAEILNVGSVKRGAGAAVMASLHAQLKDAGVKKVELLSTSRAFYERQGYGSTGSSIMRRTLEFNPDQPRDEAGKWSGSGGTATSAAEQATQEQRAAAQTHPLAHPDFVIGGSNNPAVHRYVAAYGEAHTPAPLPEGIEQGAPRECYKNASLLVMGHPELTYAEGFAKSDRTGEMVFQHAWAVTKDGVVVDPTWDTPEKNEYFGVRYERAAYLKYLYTAKIYGVLGSTEKNVRMAVATGGAKLRAAAFNPEQPRDEHGQWAAGGSVSQALLDTRFPVASETVDGRQVSGFNDEFGPNVPNMSSISASLTHYEILDGIREVKVSDFEDNGKPSFYSRTEEARVQKLAAAIKESGRISPLIVVVDKHQSPYVLEGGHRFDALKINGAKSFPALVVVDTSELKVLAFNPDQPRDEHGRWTDTSGHSTMLGRPASDYTPSRPDGLDTQERFSDGHGHYTPQRAALHEEIIAKHMAGVTSVKNPTVTVLGGAPGVGKSTTVKNEGIGGENTVLINPDDIRNDLPEYAPDATGRRPALTAFTHEEASDISAKMIKRTAKESKNAVLDGTGDSSIEKLGGKVAVLRSKGARVEAVYVTTSVEVAQMRADARSNNPASSSFGRVVPPTAMREMHKAVSRVFPEAIRQGLFDRARLFDSTAGHKLVASAEGRKLTIHDQAAWDAFVGKGQ